MIRNPWDEPLSSDELTADEMFRKERTAQVVSRCLERLQKSIQDTLANIQAVTDAIDRMQAANERASPEDMAREIMKALRQDK